jgi:hypothetical protein
MDLRQLLMTGCYEHKQNWPYIWLTQIMLDIGSGIKSAQKEGEKLNYIANKLMAEHQMRFNEHASTKGVHFACSSKPNIKPITKVIPLQNFFQYSL